MARSPMMDAARIVGSLVPQLVDQDSDALCWEHVNVDSLSTGERAAFEIARELWIGNGALTQYVLHADYRYASTLVTAMTVAMRNAIMAGPWPE